MLILKQYLNNMVDLKNNGRFNIFICCNLTIWSLKQLPSLADRNNPWIKGSYLSATYHFTLFLLSVRKYSNKPQRKILRAHNSLDSTVHIAESPNYFLTRPLENHRKLVLPVVHGRTCPFKMLC